MVLIDGELASTWRRVHRLNDYVSQELIDDPFDGEVSASLLKAPTVDAASESNAVVIGFADSASGAFVQLELSTPAVELAELADSLADHLDSTNLCENIENEQENALTSVARQHGYTSYSSVAGFAVGLSRRWQVMPSRC